MTPEGATLKACMTYLAACNIFCFRNNTGGTPLHDGSGRYRPAPKSSVGSADIIAVGWRNTIHNLAGGGVAQVRMPCPIAAEVKSKTGRQSPAQKAFQAKWEQAGGVYILCRSVDELRDGLRDAGVDAR